jgi:DMSO/TMAO reductase YedYZ heme-binding membrane subunit
MNDQVMVPRRDLCAALLIYLVLAGATVALGIGPALDQLEPAARWAGTFLAVVVLLAPARRLFQSAGGDRPESLSRALGSAAAIAVALFAIARLVVLVIGR